MLRTFSARYILGDVRDTRAQLHRGLSLGASAGVAGLGPAVESPEFFQRVNRYQAPLHDSDAATAQTVELMAERIRESARDPRVVQTARAAVDGFRGGPLYGMSGRDPWSDPLAIAESCWWLAKSRVKFVHHNEHIARWWGENDQLQLLISPEVLLQMRRPEGDCAIFTMLICALLETLGITWEIVTAAVNPNQPDVFSHVWPRVVLPNGQRVNLDASHGDYPGWQVPAERQYKVQVWDESGRPVANAGSFEGLHGYVRRGMGGEADDIQEGGTYVPPSGENPTQVFFPSSGSGAGNTGFNTGAFLANLANQWTQIGSRVLAPSTEYVRGADGSVRLVTPGASPVATSSILSGGSGGMSWVLLGGLGLGAVLLVSMMGKK